MFSNHWYISRKTRLIFFKTKQKHLISCWSWMIMSPPAPHPMYGLAVYNAVVSWKLPLPPTCTCWRPVWSASWASHEVFNISYFALGFQFIVIDLRTFKFLGVLCILGNYRTRSFDYVTSLKLPAAIGDFNYKRSSVKTTKW